MKLCCVRCFNEKHMYLTNFIKENGKPRGTCDFCGTKKTTVIAPGKLEPLFRPLLSLYSPLEIGENMLPDEEWIDVGESFAFLVDEEFSVFSDAVINRADELMEAIFTDGLSPWDLLETLHFGADSLWCDRDKTFYERTSKELWETFSSHLKYDRRFIPDEQNSEIEDPRYWLPPIFKMIEKVIPIGEHFFRGRTGKLKLEDMGIPPRKSTPPGRANPRGIPFLYMAIDKNTVVAEIRPWLDQDLTIATFELIEQVKVIDLTTVPVLESPFGHEGDLHDLRERYRIPHLLSHKLSLPVSPDTSELDYLPTQYLTEIIRAEGYDGMLYNSAMHQGGLNLVLFSANQAKAISVEYVTVTSIHYNTSPGIDMDDEIVGEM